MFDQFVGKTVVLDLRSPYVCLGTLVQLTDESLVLRDADLHDLRDSDTSRENYTAESKATGIKRNRKEVLIVRSEVVAISELDHVVDD